MKKIFGYVDFDKKFHFSADSELSYLHDTNFYKNGIIYFSTKQPKTTQRLQVSFYGTIYNKKSLKNEFGITDEIDDNHLIEKGFELFSTKLFKKIDGVFTIIIFDKDTQILYLVRDYSGIAPLYLYDYNDTIIFGNSLKDFYKIPTFTKKIDKNALAIYLNYGYILQPYVIFEYTHKVQSGHFIELNLKNKQWQQKEYWSLESCYNEPKLDVSEKEIVSSVETILDNSINKRINSNKSIATTLSGGYDSSIVTALLKENCNNKIDTFTIGFSQQEINEAPYAKKIASHLKTNHHEHYFSIEDAKEIVPKLCQIYDEPFADYGATPTVLLSQLVKKAGFDELFIGDGGDEIFATADDVTQFETILKTPIEFRKTLFYLLNSINPAKIPLINRYQNIPTKYYKFINLLNSTTIPQMVKLKPLLFIDSEIKTMLKSDNLNFKSPFDEIEFPPNAHAVDQVIGTYFKTSMADAELVKSSQAARDVNLSLKEPLLDIELISYMAKIKQDIKIKNGEKKYILKQIAYKYIPKNLLDRPKSGFDIPFSMWLKEPLKDLVYEQINEHRLKIDNIFDVNSIIEIRDTFYSGNEAYKYKLWTIFLFQLWYENITKD